MSNLNKQQFAKTKSHEFDSDITDLQNQLLKSLTTVFDPNAKPISDDMFLATNFDRAQLTDYNDDPEQQIKNPYQELAERAKNYASTLENQLKDPNYKKKPAKKKPEAGKEKNPTTFKLTDVGLEGNL